MSAAGSIAPANKCCSVPGGEALPPFLGRAAFGLAKPLSPYSNMAMGIRDEGQNIRLDPAKPRFGWSPRKFSPVFD